MLSQSNMLLCLARSPINQKPLRSFVKMHITSLHKTRKPVYFNCNIARTATIMADSDDTADTATVL